MPIAKVLSSAVLGIDAYMVEVEADIAGGLPAFFTVGLPDSAVKESKERVNAAIANTGYYFPLKRITINLAPADIRKEGSAYDLPMAVGIMAATGQIQTEKLQNYAILGELSLNGDLRAIRGALPIAVAVKQAGLEGIMVPKQNEKEAAIVDGLKVLPVETLTQAVEFLNNDLQIEPAKINLSKIFEVSSKYDLDFCDVKGQEHVKRALEVAAAGGHNIIMVGPPGSGKTMLARRLPTILPEMSLAEALETTKIHSVVGALNQETFLIATRPFRAPHHTISDAGLIGGGRHPRPGEVSVSHNGVLFLDELPEFKKNVLEVMRQPLEDGHVTIARAMISLTYPARFMLACAMNPCPCGYYTDPTHQCSCTQPQIQKYLSRVSGPLLDRIDIHVEVPSVKYKELSDKRLGEPSLEIRKRINRARKIQLERLKNREKIFCNAHMGPRELRKFCQIDSAADDLLRTAITRFGLSARAYDRILKVSRTIADLEESEGITAAHISEAIQYRSLDRSLWT